MECCLHTRARPWKNSAAEEAGREFAWATHSAAGAHSSRHPPARSPQARLAIPQWCATTPVKIDASPVIK